LWRKAVGNSCTELAAPDLCCFDVEVALQKLKRSKSPGSNKITAEFISGISETFGPEMFSSIWNNEVLRQSWNECIIVSIHVKEDKAECTNY
jgi:hypothetical protein